MENQQNEQDTGDEIDFREFYRSIYLEEHSDSVCRILHFVGFLFILTTVFAASVTGIWELFVLIPVWGYGFGWTGHFFFENNKPATANYPLYSLYSYFIMNWEILTGKISSSPQ